MNNEVERILNEKKFHNLRFGEEKKVSRYYKALENWYQDYLLYIVEVDAKEILEIGSGDESIAFELEGNNISSIDISDICIAKMRSKGLKNTKFICCDAHKTDFEDASFSLVCGRGILHHLNLDLIIEEIKRLIKSDGKMIFGEPLSANPFINLYRKITPRIRTKDEKPLSNGDIKKLAEKLNLSVHYYGFLTIAPTIVGKKPNKTLFRVDNFILNRLKLGKWIAWACLLKS